MLKYDRNAKMTFCVFMSQERHKPFLAMFIFIIGVSPSNFVVSFLLTSLQKDYFLRQRLRRYRFLKAGTACCWFLIFGYQLLTEFQCEIDFCMMDGYDFSSIMLTFLYLSVTTVNVSFTSKALLGDDGSTLCSVVIANFNLLSTFRYIRICQRNSGYYPCNLLR